MIPAGIIWEFVHFKRVCRVKKTNKKNCHISDIKYLKINLQNFDHPLNLQRMCLVVFDPIVFDFSFSCHQFLT